MTATIGDMSRSITLKMTNPIVINFSCYASGKWAEHFLIAAQSFPANIKFSPVPYFLYCQALELSLKAFLLLNGVSKGDLKKKALGHNLVALLAKAKTLNLEKFVMVSEKDEKLVAMVNDFYDIPGKRRLQYIDVGWALNAFEGLPQLTELAGLVSRVVTEPSLKAMYQTSSRASTAILAVPKFLSITSSIASPTLIRV
jgi:hypothetical protein